MRASVLSWPKASGLPLFVCAAAIVQPLAALAAGDAPASVSFVDREALGANGWNGSAGNPLRAPSDARPSQFAQNAYGPNSLRNSSPPSDEGAYASQPDEEVVPASYDSRDPNGLQLRPYTPPTGIFSGDSPTPQSRPNQYPPQQRSKSPNKTAAAQTTAERTKGLVPEFLSFAPKTKPKPTQPTYGYNSQALAAGPPASPTARAGSAAQSSPYGTISRSQSQAAPANPASARQAAYASAAAAESYRHAGMPAGDPSASRRIAQPPAAPIAVASNPNARLIAARQSAVPASYGGTSPSPSAASPDNSPAAQMLVQAHAIADQASTEEDFSHVYAACQRVMASQPTAAEAGFAKQLAAWSLNRRGQIRASAGHTEDALGDFSAAIQLDPKLWRAIHNRGVLEAQAGQFDKAFDDFNRTIELNPQFAKAFSNRASLYVVAGQMEPALNDYRRACELDPNLVVAQRGCGRVCHMLGQLEEAGQHLNCAIELAPNDASALSSRADLLTDLGSYSDAAADYDRALKLDGKSAEACRGSAWLLATCPDNNVRNPDVAIRRAELAVKLDRKPDATTYDTLAAAQASAGDFAAATQTIRRAIELAKPSERSVYQDRLSMYRQSMPFRIAPLPSVQQAQYSANIDH
jgi:tetratricopeptide (TPR) repeat protein